jgi:hypothetical protein
MQSTIGYNRATVPHHRRKRLVVAPKRNTEVSTAQILANASALDERRQAQIANQVAAINRLLAVVYSSDLTVADEETVKTMQYFVRRPVQELNNELNEYRLVGADVTKEGRVQLILERTGEMPL